MANTPERMTHDPLAWLLGDDDPEPAPAAASSEPHAATEPAQSEPCAAATADAAPEQESAQAAAAPDGQEPAATDSGPADGIVLDESLTVEVAAELKGRLMQLLDGRDQIRLDAAAVARADAAGLQLLVAFCTAVEQRGSVLVWAEVSDPLRHAARLSGLERALRLP